MGHINMPSGRVGHLPILVVTHGSHLSLIPHFRVPMLRSGSDSFSMAHSCLEFWHLPLHDLDCAWFIESFHQFNHLA